MFSLSLTFLSLSALGKGEVEKREERKGGPLSYKSLLSISVFIQRDLLG